MAVSSRTSSCPGLCWLEVSSETSCFVEVVRDLGPLFEALGKSGVQLVVNEVISNSLLIREEKSFFLWLSGIRHLSSHP